MGQKENNWFSLQTLDWTGVSTKLRRCLWRVRLFTSFLFDNTPPAYCCTQSVIKLLIVICYGKQNNLEPFLTPIFQSWVVFCFLKVALTPTQHRLVRMGGGSGMKSALFPFWCRLFQDSRESASIKVAWKPRGSWGGTGNWSSQALFSIPHSGIPAPSIPCDWLIWQLTSTPSIGSFGLASHTQRQRKNSERVKPSFTAHFDI